MGASTPQMMYPYQQPAVACSSHVSSSKKKDTLLACLSFWVSAAEGRLHPSVFQCSGRQSHHCSKVFASGENTCTPQKRRGPEGPLGEQGLMHKISILTVLFPKGLLQNAVFRPGKKIFVLKKLATTASPTVPANFFFDLIFQNSILQQVFQNSILQQVLFKTRSSSK